MRLQAIGLANYRNIELARLDLDASRVLFVGKNGQGKTNLLEAIGYVTALRAFRTRENEVLIGPVRDQAEISYSFQHEDLGEVHARAVIKRKGKEAQLDGEPVKRVSDLVGRFPTVTLSSEDLSIVRGSPGGRRRFVDTFLCGVDRSYYLALQTYQKCIQERNALLKKDAEPSVLAAFERQLYQPGLEVIAKRAAALEELGRLAQGFYATLADAGEAIGIEYRPNIVPESESAYREIMEKNRRRDGYLQSTGKGPHRDDFDFSLEGRPAADYASDGQQRSIALALAFATIAYWRTRFKVAPVLLVDDVLGELDPERKARFWEILDSDVQLIATGTESPRQADREDWRVFSVESGRFLAV